MRAIPLHRGLPQRRQCPTCSSARPLRQCTARKDAVSVDGMGASEAEGLVLQNDSWVAGVGEHSRW